MDFLGECVATSSGWWLVIGDAVLVNKIRPTGEKNFSEYLHDRVLLHSTIGLYNMFRFSAGYFYSK